MRQIRTQCSRTSRSCVNTLTIASDLLSARYFSAGCKRPLGALPVRKSPRPFSPYPARMSVI
eukprot:1188680-Prorocentrum_minimum.AAC.2